MKNMTIYTQKWFFIFTISNLPSIERAMSIVSLDFLADCVHSSGHFEYFHFELGAKTLLLISMVPFYDFIQNFRYFGGPGVPKFHPRTHAIQDSQKVHCT